MFHEDKQEEEESMVMADMLSHFIVGVVDPPEPVLAELGVQGLVSLAPGVPGVTNRPGGRGLLDLTLFIPWFPPLSRPPRMAGK